MISIAGRTMSQEVINSKGSRVFIDSSKWTVSGNHIYNKNSGNVGIGVSLPTAQLHTTLDVRFAGIGTNTTNTKILTTDAYGNVTTRLFSNLLSGNALTSLNGLTNSVQTFATGTSGSSFNIVSSGQTHTFNLPAASATSSGTLSSADWTIFNNKTSSVTASTTAAVTTVYNIATINNSGAYWNANKLQGNAIAATTPANGQVLSWNGTAWTPAAAAPATTTHTISSAANIITSVVNGVSVTAPAVNSISNTSAANTLTTTVNGITGSQVSMINTNTLTQNGTNQLTSTVNGVATAALTVNTSGDVTGNLGATVVSKINGSPLGTITGATSGQVLSWNGNAWVPATAAPATTTNILNSNANTITSIVNGVSETATAVNSVSNTSSANTLTTTVNGVTGSSVNMVNSNTLTQNGSNQLVSTVNGVASTPLTAGIDGDVIGELGTTLVSKINGSPLGITTTATSGQVLSWNGAAWVPATTTQSANAESLTSNFTTSSTSATNTNLSFAIGANESYYVTIEGSASKAFSSSGMKLAIAAPSGCTISGEAYLGGSSLSTAPTPSLITAINTLGSTFATGNGVRVTFRMTFQVTNSSTAGNITLQAATVSSNTATIFAGTRMSWIKTSTL